MDLRGWKRDVNVNLCESPVDKSQNGIPTRRPCQSSDSETLRCRTPLNSCSAGCRSSLQSSWAFGAPEIIWYSMNFEYSSNKMMTFTFGSWTPIEYRSASTAMVPNSWFVVNLWTNSVFLGVYFVYQEGNINLMCDQKMPDELPLVTKRAGFHLAVKGYDPLWVHPPFFELRPERISETFSSKINRGRNSCQFIATLGCAIYTI